MATPAYSRSNLRSSPPVREPSLAEVQSELRSLLDSREFRQSKGLSRLLRYLCGKVLVGDPEAVTEYIIARDVFGKPEDFKDSHDACVRVEVHRLRRRLADFYGREGASHRVQLVIPTGRYTPEFLVRADPGPVATEAEKIADAPPSMLEPVWNPPPTVRPLRVPDRFRLSAKLGASTLVLVALGLIARVWIRSSDPLDGLWRPVLASSSPTLLCIGDMSGGRPSGDLADTAELTLLGFHFLKSQSVLLNDAATMTRFAGLLQSRGKAYRVVSQSEATFSDLQSGPTVLIGLANNYWSERLVGRLRFWLQRTEPGGKLVIRDREHVDRTDWNMDFSMPLLQVTKDYALVLRVLDPKTEQTVISAAGISAFGTLAAGDFLTNAAEFRKVEAIAPRGWLKMNFELVLSTEVIRGKSGRANIVAWHFWK